MNARKRSKFLVQIIVLASILAANLVPVFACHPVVGGDCEKAWAQAVASSGTMKVWIDDVLVLDQYVQDGDYFEWTEADGIDFCAEHEIRAEYFGQTSTVTFGGSHCCPTYSVSANGTCSSHGASGHSDTSALLRVTGTDANGDAISHEETVNGSFSSTWNNVDPEVYGPNPVHVVAKLLVNSKVVKSDTFDDSLICGIPQGNIEVSVSCKGIAVSGYSDEETSVDWSFQDERGSESVGPGNFSFDAGTPIGTYGPHNLSGAAAMIVGGVTYSGDNQINAICGPAQGSISVELTCKGMFISGHSDEPTTVNWEIDNESGSFNVEAGDFSRTVGTTLDTYGPHDRSGSAHMEVGGNTISDSASVKNLICGPFLAIYTVESYAGCDKGQVKLETNVTGTFDWSIVKNGEAMSEGSGHVEAGTVKTVSWDLKHYGPYSLRSYGKFTPDDTKLKPVEDEVDKRDLTCGSAQGKLSVSVSCQGLNISGNTDEATVINWDFRNESGTMNVEAGGFSFKVGTPLTTYGPHKISGNASMDVGGVIYSDSDTMKDAICGPAQGKLSVSVSCQGIKVSGYSDVATLLKWTFQEESGFIRAGPGTFNIKAGTLIASYGPHDLVGWASIVIYGKIFSDTARLPQAVCGPKEDYELSAFCLPDGRGQGWAHANSTWVWGRMVDGQALSHAFRLNAGEVFSFTTSYILYEAETWAYSVTSPDGTKLGSLNLPRCKEPEKKEPKTGIWGKKSVKAPYWLIEEVVDRFATTEMGKQYRLDDLRLTDGREFASYVSSNPDEIIEVWGAGFHAAVGGRAQDLWFEGGATSDGWDGIFSVDLKGEQWFKSNAYAAALYQGFMLDSPFEVIAREHSITWTVKVVEAPNGIGDSQRVLLSESPLPKNGRSYVGWWRNEWVPKPPEGGRSEISFINGQVVGSVFGAELLFKGNDLDEPGWNQAALYSGHRVMLHLDDNNGQRRAGAKLNNLSEGDAIAMDLGDGLRLYRVTGSKVVEQSYQGFASLYTMNGFTLFTCAGNFIRGVGYTDYLAVQVVFITGPSLIQ